MVKKNKGFNLIELLIVIAVIGVLVFIAYPSYVQYNVKTHRVDMQTEMIRIASALQRYQMLNATYLVDDIPITLADLNISTTYPNAQTALYTLNLSDVTAGTWILTATPVLNEVQQGNGSIVLTHSGEKCWTEGQVCVPTSNTTW